MNDYIQLGVMNGWRETPKELEQCRQQQHELVATKTGWTCYTVYHCPVCKIQYAIDSSD